MEGEEENLKFVHDYFSDIFSKEIVRDASITANRAKIAKIRKKVITDSLKTQFEAPISESEIKDAIKSLAFAKTPGPDGLPNEFYKEFDDMLCPLLLKIWEETVHYGCLPISVNTGVIKLIHKRGDKNNLNNWRPITCLNSIYKIFALVLAKRISPHLDDLILKEQKGFIKGRFILDAIISLWEGMEHVNNIELDILFFKIDFDKAYDRVEWDFILQSLHDMGFGKNFIKGVHCLLGNARTLVSLNGSLSPAITLRRSIRQGCPLAPLLFVIVADALGWLIQDSLSAGLIKGVPVPGITKHLCLQQFADDTNSFIRNEQESVDNFLDCLQIFCTASGSVINHSKTGVWASNQMVPPAVLQAGCKVIQDGSIFRLLGIPMGFGISLKERWLWVVDKFKSKLNRWKGYQPNLPSRAFVLNHFILPSLVFFLSCWRPPQSHLKMINSVISSFLWGGTGQDKKMCKVSLKTCFLPKTMGGLGLLDVNLLAIKLASKWIYRAMGSSDYWAQLLTRNCPKFCLKSLKAWSGFSAEEVFYSKQSFIYKGSELVKGLWGSWDKYRPMICVKNSAKAVYDLMSVESLWIGLLGPCLNRDVLLKAHRVWKMGFKAWSDLANGNGWDPGKFAHLPIHLRNLLEEKLNDVLSWGLGPPSTGAISPNQVCIWDSGKTFYPLPTLFSGQETLFNKLNLRWGINWNHKQWSYRFKTIWGLSVHAKKACLLWLILHKAVWTGEKALKIGKGTGVCPRCKKGVETLEHLFFACEYNLKYFKFLHICFFALHPNPFSAPEILLGECYHLDILLWHNIRSSLLFHIWKERNSSVFGEGCTSQMFSFLTEMRIFLLQANREVKDALLPSQTPAQLMQNNRWQKWQKILAKFYTKEKMMSLDGLHQALALPLAFYEQTYLY